MGSDTAVVVMTARGPDRIIQEGGSQAWVLNPKNAMKHRYLITVQNRHNGQWGGATEPHGTAFLIGKISDVVPSPEPKSKGRYLVKINEYARISISCKWRGSNPVRYLNIKDEFGIDPETLEFIPVPSQSGHHVKATQDALHEDEVESTEVLMLTIAQAKTGLAANLGIELDQIEIIIKA
ncbi:hypothetical protein KW842_25245 [Duganella sp. sic0402]|uniref:hypothetical protein n=1 Tax=Duganella sp. sic0402 TaxID=2854786 RepID=UPI001C48C73A|nr:hypothetical protein [Duganella sp. sic0402]MBV7539079.1 hypothetical protein [Duganella sp. sic0402]